MDEDVNTIKAGTVYSGAGQFDGPHRTFVLQPNGQIDEAEGYRNLIVARNKDNSPVYLRDVAEVKRGVQDERHSRFFFARGFNPPGSDCRACGFAAGRRERCRGREFGQSSFSRAARKFARLDHPPPGIRSFANDCEFRPRCAHDIAHRVRAGGAGHLRLSGARKGHFDSGRRVAAFVAAHSSR